MSRVASVLLCFAVAGCAGASTQIPGVTADEVANEKRQQQIFQVRTAQAQATRLHNVGYRLSLANRDDCRDSVAPRIGIRILSSADVPAAVRDDTVVAMQLDQSRPTIISVADRGPAAKSGVVAGDVIAAINDDAPPESGATAWLNQHLANGGGRSVRLSVVRNGQAKTLTVVPTTTCSVPYFLAESSSANAYTDGKRIVVQAGVMRVAQNDAELALVLGHELAHVNMAHLDKRKQNAAAGAVGGLAADVGLALLGVNTGGAFTKAGSDLGAIAYASDFEREADYVGAYYAARAGYDVSGVERFWRALAQENPKQVSYAGLHPTTPERFVQMQKTVAEISDKKRRHAALVPERRQAPIQTAAERMIGAE
jgi:hypothetical protein